MDPRTRLTKGREAASAGRHAEALRDYVWFHHHALKHDRAFYGVRLSFALSYWMELAEAYPEARTTLERIRNEKTRVLSRGEGDRGLFHDVASINEHLGGEPATYELFRELERRSPELATKCADLALEAIVKARDFDLARKYSPDPENALLRYSADLNEDVAGLEVRAPIKAPRLDAYIHIYCNRVRTIIQILEGLGYAAVADHTREWAVALVEGKSVRARVLKAVYEWRNAA